MDPNRQTWNDRHIRLRHAIKAGDGKTALATFLIQHAMVHSARVSKTAVFSFEDEILDELPLNYYRMIPPKSSHSIAWIIWHIARVEDVVMNLLISDKPQVLHEDEWLEKLRIQISNTGNGMSDKEVRSLSKNIDTRNLRAYRVAVGRATRKIVKGLKPVDYKHKVDPSRIQRIWDEPAMLPNAGTIVNYWSSRTMGGLLLMPPTRHSFLHLNEARRLSSTLRKLNR